MSDLHKDQVAVATGGTIDRADRCGTCGRLLFYAVDQDELVQESFCGNSECSAFLITVEHKE